jgi:hypothetical protein
MNYQQHHERFCRIPLVILVIPEHIRDTNEGFQQGFGVNVRPRGTQTNLGPGERYVAHGKMCDRNAERHGAGEDRCVRSQYVLDGSSISGEAGCPRNEKHEILAEEANSHV